MDAITVTVPATGEPTEVFLWLVVGTIVFCCLAWAAFLLWLRSFGDHTLDS